MRSTKILQQSTSWAGRLPHLCAINPSQRPATSSERSEKPPHGGQKSGIKVPTKVPPSSWLDFGARGNMLKFIGIASAVVLLAGCSSMPDRDRNTLIGAGVGAGIGAAVGSASGGPPGTLAGAAIGAVTGGVVGYIITPEACYFRNKRGEIWRVPCEDRRVRAAACFVGHGPDNLRQVPCS